MNRRTQAAAAFEVAKMLPRHIVLTLRSAVSAAIESGDGIGEFRERFHKSLSAMARRAAKHSKKRG